MNKQTTTYTFGDFLTNTTYLLAGGITGYSLIPAEADGESIFIILLGILVVTNVFFNVKLAYTKQQTAEAEPKPQVIIYQTIVNTYAPTEHDD